MKVSYRGIQGELPPKSQEKLDARFGMLSKLLEKRGEQEAHVVITTERHLHHAEITMPFYDHQFVGLGSGSDLITAISEAIDKLETQAKKEGARRRAKARRADSPEPAEADEQATVMVSNGSKPGNHKKARVYRVDHQDGSKPITLEEAILEMEDQRDYVVYRDADKQCLSVLVRRRDGNFDLIES